MHDDGDRTNLLIRLREGIAACGRSGQTDRSIVPTEWPALDRVLSGGGVRRGSLVELLDERAGCGAETIAAVLTRAVCQAPGVVVVVDRNGEFYPPALAAWGIGCDRLIVVRPANEADAMWAADQALRSRAAVAVWLRADRLTPPDYRRLQLSAVEGGAVGVLFGPARSRGQPTGADLQLAVEPRPSSRGRLLHVEVTRCRGGVPGAAAEVCVRSQESEDRRQRTENRKPASSDLCPLSSVLCPLLQGPS